MIGRTVSHYSIVERSGGCGMGIIQQTEYALKDLGCILGTKSVRKSLRIEICRNDPGMSAQKIMVTALNSLCIFHF